MQAGEKGSMVHTAGAKRLHDWPFEARTSWGVSVRKELWN